MRTFALIALLLTAACGERPHETFATGSAALRSAAARQGWVPAWLPPTAEDVALQYDLDTNEQWLRFSLPEPERSKFVSQFGVVPESDIPKLKFRAAPDPNWWFESLIVQHPENDNGVHVDAYRSRDGLVFVDRMSPRVYVYSAGG